MDPDKGCTIFTYLVHPMVSPTPLLYLQMEPIGTPLMRVKTDDSDDMMDIQ